MSVLIPRNGTPRLQRKAGFPGAAQLGRYDAVLVMQPTTASPDRRLPFMKRWLAAHARGKPAHATARATTLDDPRQCLAVLAYCRDDADAFERLRAAGQAVQKLLAERPQATRIAVLAQTDTRDRAVWQEALCAALLAQSFRLPRLRSSATTSTRPLRIDLFGESKLDLRRTLVSAEATNLVRHLTALPPNLLDARGYRGVVQRLARSHGLRLRWYGERQRARLGAGAFLAVCRGSSRREAGIAHLSYRPRNVRRRGAQPVALVGKGIVFDTGGTNLKPHRSMLDMHIDMSGSAVALATTLALAKLRVPFAVDAWLAITDNAIGPAAYRPQEVIRALNGTMIQVIHTDAEGRMVLADTLAMAARSRPRLIMDFATLTGACIGALTERYSGAFASSDKLADTAVAAGRASGERLWPFPLSEDFDTDLDSPTADIAQCALEGKGDHILAARFLRRFVPQDIPWLHIDLSSTTRRGGLAHVPTEITGFGARVALALLLDQAAQR